MLTESAGICVMIESVVVVRPRKYMTNCIVHERLLYMAALLKRTRWRFHAVATTLVSALPRPSSGGEPAELEAGSNQKQSEAIRSNQKQPEAIRRNQKQSEATRSNPKQPEATRSNQKQSEAIRSNQLGRRARRATRSPVKRSRSETLVEGQGQTRGR